MSEGHGTVLEWGARAYWPRKTPVKASGARMSRATVAFEKRLGARVLHPVATMCRQQAFQ